MDRMDKAPADQFYWSDWLRDVELQSASTVSRGVWINALCRMWFSNPQGELKGEKEKLALLCNAKIDEFDLFLSEAKALEFCEVLQNSHGVLTLRNRRMYKKGKKKEADRLRQQRYYAKKKSHADSPKSSQPYSSSPSPKHSARARTKQNPYQKEDDPRSNWQEKPICEKCGDKRSHSKEKGPNLCLDCIVEYEP